MTKGRDQRSLGTGHGAAPALRCAWFLAGLSACGGQAVLDGPADGSVDDSVPVADSDATPEPTGVNVLLIIADDVGRDAIRSYGQHPDAPPTPVIDGLAAQGVRFDRAWASPACSPARATILTGRHARRTGLGDAVQPWTETIGLPLEEMTLPEVLQLAPTPWSSAFLGKWHLGTPALGGLEHPVLQGFDRFDGTVGNLMPGHSSTGEVQSYTHWEKVQDGAFVWSDRYATTETIDDAIDAVRTLPSPWLVVTSLHAAHQPFHVPPAPLPGSDTTDRSDPSLFRAMVQAMDAELGRLLDALDDDERARTWVFFVGDNGTPSSASTPPFSPDRAKKTIFEGGIGVPLIIAGPGVTRRGAVSRALVHTVDLLPTVADIAGLRADDERLPVWDGTSLLPVLADPDVVVREVQYAEYFTPNGVGVERLADVRAVAEDRYKLAVGGGLELLFDLDEGPVETDDLLARGPLSADAEAALIRLRAALADQARAFGDAP